MGKRSPKGMQPACSRRRSILNEKGIKRVI
jgi:hypothetical protein